MQGDKEQNPLFIPFFLYLPNMYKISSGDTLLVTAR